MRPPCFHCPNPQRCGRLGCYAFNARARRLADEEERKFDMLVDLAKDDIAEVFRLAPRSQPKE